MNFLAVLGISLIELDAAHLCQFMVSRPLVLGPALGLLLGDPGLGIMMGILFELYSLEDLPVGATVVPSATVSAGSAVLLALGPGAVPPELAFPAGLLLGRLHRILETHIRRRRVDLACAVSRCLAEGGSPEPASALRKAIAQHAAGTALFLAAALYAVKPLLAWSWLSFPAALKAGMGTGFALAPWLGAAVLIKIFLAPALGKA